jgi:hypothetical protein
MLEHLFRVLCFRNEPDGTRIFYLRRSFGEPTPYIIPNAEAEKDILTSFCRLNRLALYFLPLPALAGLIEERMGTLDPMLVVLAGAILYIGVM